MAARVEASNQSIKTEMDVTESVEASSTSTESDSDYECVFDAVLMQLNQTFQDYALTMVIFMLTIHA